MVKNKENLEKLRRFIDSHINDFNVSIQDFLKEEYVLGEDYPYYFISQIYSYLFNDEESNRAYQIFSKYLKDKFPDLEDRTILEVASGYLPTLATIINQMYKMKNPITCVDPESMLLGGANVVERKEEFTQDTDVSPYDLIITHCPYKAIDSIIDSAIKNKKEMCAQLSFIGEYSSMGRAAFRYQVGKMMEKLWVLENDDFQIEMDVTDAYDVIAAPVITVRKRKK